MYGWIWRQIPGPFLVRALLAVLLVAGLVIICFQWVYPSISDYMPFNQQTVEQPTSSPTTQAPTPASSGPATKSTAPTPEPVDPGN